MITCCPSTSLNYFSSEDPVPNFFEFHVEHSVKEGLQICTNGHGPIIKMAAMPTYAKIFSRTKTSLRLNLSI